MSCWAWLSLGVVARSTVTHEAINTSTIKWMRTLPNTSMLVQIGANDHHRNRRTGANHDPGCMGVEMGWRALLIEPTPYAYMRLEIKYRGNPRVRTRQLAVCADHATVSSRSSIVGCGGPPRKAKMWILETSNTTGNWGSNSSDVRNRPLTVHGLSLCTASHSDLTPKNALPSVHPSY
jgi:hypothetical protein